MELSSYLIDVYAYRARPDGIIWLYADKPKYSDLFEQYMSSSLIGILKEGDLEALGLTPEMVTGKPCLVSGTKIKISFEWNE